MENHILRLAARPLSLGPQAAWLVPCPLSSPAALSPLFPCLLQPGPCVSWGLGSSPSSWWDCLEAGPAAVIPLEALTRVGEAGTVG